MIETKAVLSALMAANADATKTVTKQEIGGVLNDRIVAIIAKNLKGKGKMAKKYLYTPWGKAVVANVFAGVVIKWFAAKPNAVAASTAMVDAAMRDLGNSVDVRGMVNQFIEAIDEFDLFGEVDEQSADAEDTGSRLFGEDTDKGGE